MRIEVVAFVLSGGAGKRLFPLTEDRAKPALPFGGSYRVIDFVLSNFIHSRIRKVFVLTQYESRSLEQHILEGWTPIFGTSKYNMVRLLPAKEGKDSSWYTGTADAVNQNKRYAWESKPDIVNIFGADHIYLMDISQMNDFHLSKKADLTISALPVRCEHASKKFGVLVVDKNWKMIGFEEKPFEPTPMPGSSDYCLASMGNYSFDLQVLMEELAIDQRKKDASRKDQIKRDPEHYSTHDFGFDIIPAMLKRNRNIYVYNFNKNIILGTGKNEKAYWKDIGDLDEYYSANMDLIGARPSININNPRWEIFTCADSLLPAKLIGSNSIDDSIISNGCILENSNIKNSILSYDVIVKSGASISNSIILGKNEIGPEAVIKDSIVDRGIIVPARTSIGVDPKWDRKQGFTISKKGIVIIPRKFRF